MAKLPTFHIVLPGDCITTKNGLKDGFYVVVVPNCSGDSSRGFVFVVKNAQPKLKIKPGDVLVRDLFTIKLVPECISDDGQLRDGHYILQTLQDNIAEFDVQNRAVKNLVMDGSFSTEARSYFRQTATTGPAPGGPSPQSREEIPTPTR